MSASTGSDSWRDYHKRAQPLPVDVVSRFVGQIEGHDERMLLLGVTRDLAGLGADLTAVDWCSEQISKVWIGDRPDRRAILADWREMKLPRDHFTAAVGDASLSTLAWPDDYRPVLDTVARSLVPRGLLVVRCFMAPDQPETVERIAEDVLAGRAGTFYATRWRIAMALAVSGNVGVTAIHDAFEWAFPDRQALAAVTGWSLETIDVIDAYRDSNLAFSFITRRQLLETLAERFDSARFVSSGNYPMSERYPLLVAERRR